MTTSAYDSYRPPEQPRRKKKRRGGPRPGPRRGGADGSREMPMVEDVEFSSYYGRPVVKAPPWGHEIAAYLFLGGVAGGSGLLAAGAQLTGKHKLRRNARLTAIGAVGAGTVALIADLGRPERFHHMLRTIKPSSPMSLGTWILSAFSTGAGLTAAVEVDRMTGQRLPLGPLRKLLHALERPASVLPAVLAAPLSSYTAVLLSDTAVPTWNAARNELPFVFVSSASMAAGGMAMVTTPTGETAPARILAALGTVGELVSMKLMKSRMHPTEVEPMEEGHPGHLLEWAERLAIAGGLGAAVFGGRRLPAAASGLMLLSASALTRFGMLDAGIESTKDPRHTIEPQKARLQARREAGITGDSITTTAE